jgi:hypothetical protein
MEEMVEWVEGGRLREGRGVGEGVKQEHVVVVDSVARSDLGLVGEENGGDGGVGGRRQVERRRGLQHVLRTIHIYQYYSVPDAAFIV